MCARRSTPSQQKAQPSWRATTSDCRPWKSRESGESDSYNKCNGSHMAQSGGWLQLPTDTLFLLVCFNERGQFKSQLQMLALHSRHAAVAVAMHFWIIRFYTEISNHSQLLVRTDIYACNNNNNTHSCTSILVRTFIGIKLSAVPQTLTIPTNLSLQPKPNSNSNLKTKT